MASKTEAESNYDLDKNVTAIFDVRKALGKGAYGIVWKAIDKRQRDTVALKKIYDAFRDTTDAQRTYREVVFLRAFRHHPNIIRLLGIYRATNNLDFYLVFEHMESDLHFVIKKGDILKDIHRQFVMYQLVNAMKYVHSGNVIHRDLKPSNILIDSKCRLKVGDFGLARTLVAKPSSSGNHETTENEGMMSDYVATRWYRAPEILVGCRKYTKAVDMWSLGCILGEMITEQPIFQGSSTINQMEKILSALPNVTQREIDNIGTRFGTSLLCRTIRRDYHHSLHAMFGGCSTNEIEFTTSLLMLDPNDRITANKALKHPFVSSFRCPSAEMDMRLNVQPPLRDDYRFELNDYRNGLYDMISKELTTARRGASTTTKASSARRELPVGCRTSALSTLRKKSGLEPNGLGLNSPRIGHSKPCTEPQQKHSNASKQRSHSQEQTQVQPLEELSRRSHHHKHHSVQHCGNKRHPHSPPVCPQKGDGERTLHKGHRSNLTPYRELGERPVAVATPRVAGHSKLKEKIQSQAQTTDKQKPQGPELSPTDWLEKLNPTKMGETQDARETRAESGMQRPTKERSSKQKAHTEPRIVQAITTQEPIIQKESQHIKDQNQNQSQNHNQNQIQRKVRKREEELLEVNSRSDKPRTRSEKSLLLEALLRQKQRETAAQSVDLDARVQANLDKLQAERKKMQKKILKYAAETGLTFITDKSKKNGSDGSATFCSTDSESYFTPKTRRPLVKKPLLVKKYKCNRHVKHHGNSITQLYEPASSYKFQKQQQQQQQQQVYNVFDPSERKYQQPDLMVETNRLTQELRTHEMEKHGYESTFPTGVRKSSYDRDNTRTTPGKQHTDLKPMYLDTTSALISTHQTLKEPRRRKHISGAYFQTLQQRHDIQEAARVHVNHD
ncbi:extracellular signal-regulated kinase 7 [Drosophila obscura]|uniref:extracellular signal-regulated kinase 7 n=1 Tax=Drosophila obscura TaxID=7282 RepID=UPI001BB27230|nr:extracellular signal-regulated kinase 7 [Drosophila obscura]XP_022234104.2 extracellular signal-regulated kinase 7 [Drosophila obscura]